MSYRINELKVMFGSRDYETRKAEKITYMHCREDFLQLTKERSEGAPAATVEANWLYEMLDYQHHPANRIMATLPLIVYEVENNMLSEDMADELYFAREDYEKGLLDCLPKEELEEIKKDLDYCFSKVSID